MPRRCTSSPYCPHPALAGGACREHANAKLRAKRRGSIYDTARWRRLRTEILNAEPTCRLCNEPATDVDHVVAIEDGGDPWDRHNLQPLCHEHHSEKTSRERAARRAGG